MNHRTLFILTVSLLLHTSLSFLNASYLNPLSLFRVQSNNTKEISCSEHGKIKTTLEEHKTVINASLEAWVKSCTEQNTQKLTQNNNNQEKYYKETSKAINDLVGYIQKTDFTITDIHNFSRKKKADDILNEIVKIYTNNAPYSAADKEKHSILIEAICTTTCNILDPAINDLSNSSVKFEQAKEECKKQAFYDNADHQIKLLQSTLANHDEKLHIMALQLLCYGAYCDKECLKNFSQKEIAQKKWRIFNKALLKKEKNLSLQYETKYCVPINPIPQFIIPIEEFKRSILNQKVLSEDLTYLIDHSFICLNENKRNNKITLDRAEKEENKLKKEQQLKDLIAQEEEIQNNLKQSKENALPQLYKLKKCLTLHYSLVGNFNDQDYLDKQEIRRKYRNVKNIIDQLTNEQELIKLEKKLKFYASSQLKAPLKILIKYEKVLTKYIDHISAKKNRLAKANKDITSIKDTITIRSEHLKTLQDNTKVRIEEELEHIKKQDPQSIQLTENFIDELIFLYEYIENLYVQSNKAINACNDHNEKELMIQNYKKQIDNYKSIFDSFVTSTDTLLSKKIEEIECLNAKLINVANKATIEEIENNFNSFHNSLTVALNEKNYFVETTKNKDLLNSSMLDLNQLYTNYKSAQQILTASLEYLAIQEDDIDSCKNTEQDASIKKIVETRKKIQALQNNPDVLISINSINTLTQKNAALTATLHTIQKYKTAIEKDPALYYKKYLAAKNLTADDLHEITNHTFTIIQNCGANTAHKDAWPTMLSQLEEKFIPQNNNLIDPQVLFLKCINTINNKLIEITENETALNPIKNLFFNKIKSTKENIINDLCEGKDYNWILPFDELLKRFNSDTATKSLSKSLSFEQNQKKIKNVYLQKQQAETDKKNIIQEYKQLEPITIKNLQTRTDIALKIIDFIDKNAGNSDDLLNILTIIINDLIEYEDYQITTNNYTTHALSILLIQSYLTKNKNPLYTNLTNSLNRPLEKLSNDITTSLLNPKAEDPCKLSDITKSITALINQNSYAKDFFEKILQQLRSQENATTLEQNFQNYVNKSEQEQATQALKEQQQKEARETQTRTKDLNHQDSLNAIINLYNNENCINNLNIFSSLPAQHLKALKKYECTQYTDSTWRDSYNKATKNLNAILKNTREISEYIDALIDINIPSKKNNNTSDSSCLENSQNFNTLFATFKNIVQWSPMQKDVLAESVQQIKESVLYRKIVDSIKTTLHNMQDSCIFTLNDTNINSKTKEITTILNDWFSSDPETLESLNEITNTLLQKNNWTQLNAIINSVTASIENKDTEKIATSEDQLTTTLTYIISRFKPFSINNIPPCIIPLSISIMHSLIDINNFYKNKAKADPYGSLYISHTQETKKRAQEIIELLLEKSETNYQGQRNFDFSIELLKAILQIADTPLHNSIKKTCAQLQRSLSYINTDLIQDTCTNTIPLLKALIYLNNHDTKDNLQQTLQINQRISRECNKIPSQSSLGELNQNDLNNIINLLAPFTTENNNQSRTATTNHEDDRAINRSNHVAANEADNRHPNIHESNSNEPKKEDQQTTITTDHQKSRKKAPEIISLITHALSWPFKKVWSIFNWIYSWAPWK